LRTLRADVCADRAAQTPRKDQFFFPFKKCFRIVGQRFESKDTGARDDADVLDSHRLARHPFGDLHFVGQTNRADFRVAEKSRADPARLFGDESNRDGVVHPVNVAFDGFDDLPNFFGTGVDLN